MQSVHNRNYRVLAVDDSSIAREMLSAQLSGLGHDVTCAGGVKEAQEILVREEASTFDCVLTDWCMPDQTGEDLLFWLKRHDYTLASVVLSASLDEELVKLTLRGGASDCIGKPVRIPDLKDALSRAFESTGRRRRAAATQLAVHDAGLLQRRMNNLFAVDKLPTAVTVCFHPKFQAGGDSVAFFPFDADRMLVVLGDVSGHDLKSAMLSAYFQGMLRGMVRQHVPISQILEYFNSFLIDDWIDPAAGSHSVAPEIMSLSVCSAMVDLNAGNVVISSSGFPLPARIDRDGLPWICQAESGYPLGWFDPNPVLSLSVDTHCGDHLIVWTDGLEDFADKFQISTWSIAYRLLETQGSPQELAWLAEAHDDILLVHIALSKSGKGLKKFPVLAETYKKAQRQHIDDLQNRWRRSLQFALPELAAHRLFDILLCIREAVLNGLLHGCREATDCCRLTVVFDVEMQCLRVDVADPGTGHQFAIDNREDPASGELLENHRGLMLLHGIADGIELDNNGATLRLYFNLQKESNRETILT